MGRLVVALVLTAGVARAGTMLEGVEVVRAPTLSVRLRLSGPVVATARTLPPDGERPARVYLDLPDTRLAAKATAVVGGSAALVRVRTGQFDPTTVRVVLDLTESVPFMLRARAPTITVELAVPVAPRVAVALPPLAATPLPTPSIAPPPRADARAGRPGRRAVVVLDAGHGGHDPGATGLAGVYEKTITLDLARRVAERLAAGTQAEIALTRTDDTFVPIEERVALGAAASLFVSLHANAGNPALNGVEVFYGGGGSLAAESGPGSPVRLGLDVVEAIEHTLGDVRTTVRPGDFGVLTRNPAPSVLVEIGYLTNPRDAARLGDEAYLARVAQAIADGAAAFLRDPTALAAR